VIEGRATVTELVSRGTKAVPSGPPLCSQKPPFLRRCRHSPKNAELGINYGLKTNLKTNVSLLGKFYEF
jgi:hypothetical protein